MTLSFRTRTFLLCFVPFALLLAVTFLALQFFVQSAVRDEVRSTLRRNQRTMLQAQARGALQNSGLIRVAGENASLKAGVQLALSARGNPAAQTTLEDQLAELGEHMGFDLLSVRSVDGKTLAAVARTGGRLQPVPANRAPTRAQGLFLLENGLYESAGTPLDLADENIGTLVLGRLYPVSDFTGPVAVLHSGGVVRTNLPADTAAQLGTALHSTFCQTECTLQLGSNEWAGLAAPINAGADAGGAYTLLSLEDLDAALGPIRTLLNQVFLSAVIAALLVALLVSMLSARSTERPIAALVRHLRATASTGELAVFSQNGSSVREMDELALAFNRAAVSVLDAAARLQGAYLESIESLAQALDARDTYTAGHSHRVSDLSRRVAAALHLPPSEVERIRIGALLHDIGKIGVPDSILQKPGKLTEDEFAAVKLHTVIGRRILGNVKGFAPYLDAVELHHENWDGTGYPRGQFGKETPLEARIIHVADAYDAITTDRSYRSSMPHFVAMQFLVDNAGTQFDPEIVNLFVTEVQPHPVRRTTAPLQETLT